MYIFYIIFIPWINTRKLINNCFLSPMLNNNKLFGGGGGNKVFQFNTDDEEFLPSTIGKPQKKLTKLWSLEKARMNHPYER